MSSYRFELFPENDLHDVVDVSLRLPVVDSLHDVGYIHFTIAVDIALEDDFEGLRAASSPFPKGAGLLFMTLMLIHDVFPVISPIF